MNIKKDELIDERGTCSYCGEVWKNVSYHESNHCRKNPDIADRLKDIDELHYKQIMGEINKSLYERFINDIILICEKYKMSISHEDSHGSFIIEHYKSTNIEWLKDAKNEINKL